MAIFLFSEAVPSYCANTMASLLRVRFHYGHPDIFDRIFHLTRGGISKASKTINLSEDIFAGDVRNNIDQLTCIYLLLLIMFDYF